MWKALRASQMCVCQCASLTVVVGHYQSMAHGAFRLLWWHALLYNVFNQLAHCGNATSIQNHIKSFQTSTSSPLHYYAGCYPSLFLMEFLLPPPPFFKSTKGFYSSWRQPVCNYHLKDHMALRRAMNAVSGTPQMSDPRCEITVNFFCSVH